MDRRLKRLYVSHVSSSASIRKLDRLFSEYGPLKCFNVEGPSGYLEYRHMRDAREAIEELDGKKFAGRRLKVEYAVKSTNKMLYQKREDYDADKEEGRCFRCKEKGHIARNCPEKRRGSSRVRSRRRSRSSERKKGERRREDSSRGSERTESSRWESSGSD